MATIRSFGEQLGDQIAKKHFSYFANMVKIKMQRYIRNFKIHIFINRKSQKLLFNKQFLIQFLDSRLFKPCLDQNTSISKDKADFSTLVLFLSVFF